MKHGRFFSYVSNIHDQKGLTLTELMLVIGLVLMLLGFTSINLTSSLDSASLDSAASIFIADATQQRTKAMTGDTEGSGVIDSYGIRFENDKYILFHGTTYNPSATDNFTVPLTSNLEFSSILFPSAQIIFIKGSGEISGFVEGSNSITIRNKNDSKTNTIQFNKYGVIAVLN